MSADRSPPYCPACGLFTPCPACGKPRLGVVPDSIEAAGDAIAEAMAEILRQRDQYADDLARLAALHPHCAAFDDQPGPCECAGLREHLPAPGGLGMTSEEKVEMLRAALEQLREDPDGVASRSALGRINAALAATAEPSEPSEPEEMACGESCADHKSGACGCVESTGTMRCLVCGIDEPHSLESLRAKLRETERDIKEREECADGGMVRCLGEWADLYEAAIAAHETGQDWARSEPKEEAK